MSDEMQKIKNAINEWGWVVQAKISYNNFIESIGTPSDLTREVQEIYRIIDDIVLDKERLQFVNKLKCNELFYRSRIIDPSDDGNICKGLAVTTDMKFHGYNDLNSREPILGIGREGRNNIAGMSYLYLASNPETACMEVKSSFGDVISLATFKLLEDLQIIDFSTDKVFQREDTEIHGMSLGVFFTELMGRYAEPVSSPNEYKATQIISDYLRKTGIDGIAYRSSLVPGGINYTIFNCHSSKIKFLDSRVLIHKQANHSFWDLNFERSIKSNPDGILLEYGKEIADKHKKNLSKRFTILQE